MIMMTTKAVMPIEMPAHAPGVIPGITSLELSKCIVYKIESKVIKIKYKE